MPDLPISGLPARPGTMDVSDRLAVDPLGASPTSHLTGQQVIDGVLANFGSVAFANMNISAPLTTTIAAPNTPVKIAGTTTLVLSSEFSMLSDNTLKYVGTDSKTIWINVAISLKEAAATGTMYRVYIYKNGAPISIGIPIVAENAATSLEYPGSVSTINNFTPNDEIEIFVENNTGSANVTATEMVVTLSNIESGASSSLSPASYAEIQITAVSGTLFSAPNTPTKILGTTALGLASEFTQPSNNTIEYVGNVTKVMRVNVSLALQRLTPPINKSYRIQLQKNGVTISVKMLVTIDDTPGVIAYPASLTTIVSLAPNDLLEMFIENTIDTTAITVSDMVITVASLEKSGGGAGGNVTRFVNFNPGNIRPPSDPNDAPFVTLSSVIHAIEFDGSSGLRALFQFRFPQNYVAGTPLTASVHWLPSNTDNGSLTFNLNYRSIRPAKPLLGVQANRDAVTLAPGILDLLTLTPFSPILAEPAPGTFVPGATVIFTLSRVTGTPFTGDANVANIEIEYTATN